jgi:hypothetical protein
MSFRFLELLCLRQIIEMVDLSEGVDDILGVFGKRGEGIDQVAPCMSETVCEDGFEGAGQIPAQSIAHLDWGRQLINPLREEILKIFTGMGGAGEESWHGCVFRSSHDGGGEHPLQRGTFEQ